MWRQLRWRIVSSHMIVVITGVTILLVTSQVIIAILQDDVAFGEALVGTFRSVVLIALVLAAMGAIVAGLFTSIWLARGIVRPLQQIAQGSQRIAAGHYDERVTVPDSEELALVATNFNQMAEALAEIEAQRIALIGNVSHELRTPLTGIEGYLEGVMDGVLPNDTETFAQMYQEVRRLRRLVNDLQDLSKVEAKQIALQLQSFDVVPVIERVINQLHPQTLAQNQTLETNTPATAMVYADPDRTAQVLLNLIGNAIRYTPEGGRVTVSLNLTPKLAEITIQDNGVGIPADALPYIFERFFRVDRSRARGSGGSGIGLTISRHLAWAMGGELTAESDGVGQGSTFRFSLPLDKS